MDNLIVLADLIRREAKRVESFGQLAAFLEQAGSLENATREREEMLRVAQDKHAAAQAELSQVEVALTHAQSRLNAIKEAATEASNVAQTIVQEAKTRAARLVSDAKTEVAKLREGAQAQARQIIAQANDDLAELRSAKVKFGTELSTVKEELTRSGQELAAMNGTIAAAKAAARKMFES